MSKRLLKIAFLSVAVFVIFGGIAHGGACTGSASGCTGGDTITLTNPLNCPDNGGGSGFQCVAEAIISALFKISIPIVAIMVLIGGFQLMTAGGDAEKVKSGRRTLLYAVVGFAVITIANGVVYIIQDIFKP